MPRVYVRKFDWDEARARHAAGQSIAALADEYAVTWNAVHKAITPGAYEQELAHKRKFALTGRCDDCGGPMNRLSRYSGTTRCKPCADNARANVRDGRVYCPACATWKPLDHFSPSAQRKARGVHGECRACDTARRKAWRQANREHENRVLRERRARKKEQV